VGVPRPLSLLITSLRGGAHYRKIDPLLNRTVHQIGKRRRTNKELHLNAQIGEYEIKYVVLDLGSEVNVMTKKTWALMGKPKLIYSPIKLHMANQQVVITFGQLEHVPVDIDGVRTCWQPTCNSYFFPL